MDYRTLMDKATGIFDQRADKYGDAGTTMERACVIYSMVTGEDMTPFHANMFMHSLKLARLNTDRREIDHYLDGINYLAFAGAATAVVEEPWVILDIKTPEVSPEEIVDSGIIDIAEDLTLVKPLEKKRA